MDDMAAMVLGVRGTVGSVDLVELQDVIERTYGERDRERGVAPTVAWLAEEFGELAQAVRKGTQNGGSPPSPTRSGSTSPPSSTAIATAAPSATPSRARVEGGLRAGHR
jgi:hypothetical protein